MKRAWLHEAAKFFAGVVTADFFTHWWLLEQSWKSVKFMGIIVDKDMDAAAMLIDVFFLIILIHYAWHVGKLPRVKERLYFVAAGAIFTVVCIGHLARILTGAEFTIFGWYVPIFLSWLGVVVSAYLAYASFYLAGRRR